MILAAALRWLALAGLYLVLAGDVSVSELVAAALTGGVAAAGSLVLQRVAERPLRLRVAWPRVVVQAATALLRDPAIVSAVAARALIGRPRGRIIRRHVREPRGRAARAGHRAVEILSASLAPNEYVIDDERSWLLLHRLAGAARPRDEEEPA